MPVALRRLRRGAGPYVLLLLLWYCIALFVSSIRSVIFPTPWATAVTFVQVLFGRSSLSPSFYMHLGMTLGRWVEGFFVAAVAGVVAGLLLGGPELIRRGAGSDTAASERHHGRAGLLKRLIMPVVGALQSLPSLVWMPVALLLFQQQVAAIPFIVAMAVVFAVTASTVEGVQAVDVLHVRAARMFGARGGRLWLAVLPGAAPYVWRGFYSAVTFSWWTLIAAEMVLARKTGLGFVLYDAGGGTDFEFAFAAMLTVALIGSGMRAVLHALERGALRRFTTREEAI